MTTIALPGKSSPITMAVKIAHIMITSTIWSRGPLNTTASKTEPTSMIVEMIMPITNRTKIELGSSSIFMRHSVDVHREVFLID